MWIRRDNLRNEIVLMLGQRETWQVHPFALPLVGEDNRHVGVPCESRCCGWIRARIKLHLRPRSLCPDRFQRRSWKPDRLQPSRLPFAWRQNRVPDRRVHLRRTTTRNHSHIRMRSDHCDAMNLRRIQRKLRLLILEQDDALLLQFASHLQSTQYIRDAPLHRVIHQARGEHCAQNAMHVIVHLGLGYCAGFHSLLQIVSIEKPSRLLVIHACCGSLGYAVGSSPIGENESLKLPVLLQKISEQILVFAGIVAVQAVVRTHHTRDIGFLDTDFEGQQVTFARRALVDGDVHRIASTLLIVQGIVLDVAKHMLCLDPPDHRSHHLARQHWVLAHVLERAAIARLASEVHSSAQRHVVALCAQFTADQRPVFESALQIPTRSARHTRGKRCRVAPILAAHTHAIG